GGGRTVMERGWPDQAWWGSGRAGAPPRYAGNVNAKPRQWVATTRRGVSPPPHLRPRDGRHRCPVSNPRPGQAWRPSGPAVPGTSRRRAVHSPVPAASNPQPGTPRRALSTRPFHGHGGSRPRHRRPVARDSVRSVWLTWRAAMERALYGPGGFYLRERPSGHFRTSVNASPVFAEAMLAVLTDVDARLGHPPRLDLVDMGAGEGVLVSTVLALAPPDLARRLRVTAVDLAPRPAGL